MQPVVTSRRAAELAARTSFGRLVSFLAWQWRDIGAAEDALGDALLKALEVWPVAGVPDHPDAWLLAVARRQLLQVARHDRVRRDPAVMAVLEADENPAAAPAIPDARLKLLFVCAHPAIDEKVRIPLMLQTVLGLQVAEIAPALLVATSTLAQRLVRAKQKIRDGGLRFEEPETRELAARLQQVLECIYGAFGLGVDAVDGAEARITDLGEEAVYLCQLVCDLLPQAAEARGLLALMTFCRARQMAQTDAAGNFVPLARQDVTLWDRAAIVRADQWLWQAAQQKQSGPFQLEAAVQSAHCHRLFTGTTPWQAIATLYRQINAYFPTQGSLVAGAVALGEAGNIAAGLEQLDAMDKTRIQSFQPWWVAKAHLFALQGPATYPQADAAYRTAIGLTSQQKIRNHLERVCSDLSCAR